MRNYKITSASLSLCLSLLITGPLAVQAEEVSAKTTNGTIQFEIDNDSEGGTHLPNEESGEPEEIELSETEGTETTSGILRIQFVPHFKFGTYKGISAKAMTQDVQLLNYSLGSTSANPIAPFVQVSDNRGENGAKGYWKLDVSASKFQTVDGSEVLDNVEIRIPGSTLTMDYKDSTTAQGLVKGQEQEAKILTDATSKTLIMETNNQQATSGYNVSNVFQTGYQKGMAYAGATTTAGVKFYKPKGQAPIKDAVYKSVLTWTLSDAL